MYISIVKEGSSLTHTGEYSILAAGCPSGKLTPAESPPNRKKNCKLIWNRMPPPVWANDIWQNWRKAYIYPAIRRHLNGTTVHSGAAF